MFQFPPFALTMSVTGLQPAGLPHSDISGSKPVCSSPELNAAYHVLHRLQKPRHPPFALVTFSLFVFFEWITRTLCLYTCSHLLVALKLQSTTFDLTLYHFSLSYRLIKFLLTLPRYLFSNLSMNLPLFLKRAAKIRTFFYPPNFSALFLQKFSHFPSSIWLNP